MIRVLKKSKERTEADRSQLRQTVAGIIDNVIKNGDEALKEYNKKFDGCERELLQITKEEIEAAYSEVSEEDLAEQITEFVQPPAEEKAKMDKEFKVWSIVVIIAVVVAIGLYVVPFVLV